MNDFVIPYRRYVDFEGRSSRKEFWYCQKGHPAPNAFGEAPEGSRAV